MFEVIYSPSLAEYQAFNYHVIWSKNRKVILFWVGIFVMSLMAPLLVLILAGSRINESGPGIPQLLAFPGAILAVAVLIVVLTQRAIKTRWEKAGELREEKKFSFDDVGLRVEGKSFQGFMEWSLFIEVEFWRGFVFLMTGQGQFHYFPLAGASDQAGLVALLKSKVKVR